MLCRKAASKPQNDPSPPKEIVVGSTVRIKSGRYQGSEGHVVNLRRNVVKVRFLDGAGQAEVATASCIPIQDMDDDFDF